MQTVAVDRLTKWLGIGSLNIFGLPFAGKDTQAHRLAEHFKGAVIAGGDILRNHHDQDTIKQLMATGELFPSDYYLDIVIPFLSQSEYAHKPLILSSVGRWHGEEESIIEATTQAGHPLKMVIFLRLKEADVWRRFEANERLQARGNRHDDDAEVLEKRIEEFQAKTMPVIDYYRANNMLVEVDGNHDPKTVTQAILDQLSAKIKHKA